MNFIEVVLIGEINMKLVSYKKYKAYLESFGYVLEKGTNTYYDLGFITYFFSKPGEKLKYTINVYLDKDKEPTDKVIAINHGYGSPYLGWHSVKIDMRKKFWKDLV